MKHEPFNASLVKVKLIIPNRDGHWKFQKSQLTGTIYEYEVEDQNFRSFNKWIFEVCVPNKFHSDAYILVKPTRHPQKPYWADTERQAVNFAQATTGAYRGQVYAKLNIADVTGKKNKIGITKGKRSLLPVYIRKFSLRLKKTVASTHGTDGNYQVAITQHYNHRAMIRLFFALKVWVMHDNFSLAE
jgi:hypothetical protein